MTWHPPVPRRVTDPAGKVWLGPARRGPASRQAVTSWKSGHPTSRACWPGSSAKAGSIPLP